MAVSGRCFIPSCGEGPVCWGGWCWEASSAKRKDGRVLEEVCKAGLTTPQNWTWLGLACLLLSAPAQLLQFKGLFLPPPPFIHHPGMVPSAAFLTASTHSQAGPALTAPPIPLQELKTLLLPECKL